MPFFAALNALSKLIRDPIEFVCLDELEQNYKWNKLIKMISDFFAFSNLGKLGRKCILCLLVHIIIIIIIIIIKFIW